MKYFLVATLLTLFACGKKTDEISASADSTAAITVAHEEMPGTEDEIFSEDSVSCPRDTAEPIVKKDVFPNATFELDRNTRVGIEKFELSNGDRITIRNSGCEYFVLTFRFETERFDTDTTDIISWLGHTQKLLKEVEKGIDSRQISDGIKGLDAFLQSPKKDYQAGQEIVFSEGDIRNYATFEGVHKTGDTRFVSEISFLSGPY